MVSAVVISKVLHFRYWILMMREWLEWNCTLPTKSLNHLISLLERKKPVRASYVYAFSNTLLVFWNVKFPNGKTSFMKIMFRLSSSLVSTNRIYSFSFLMHSWSVTERGGKGFLAGINSNRLTVYNLKTNRTNRE